MFSMCERERVLIKCVLISQGQIKDRCDKLAEQIFDDYKGQVVHMVIILTGAYQFFLDLNTSLKKVRAIRNPKTEKEDVLLKFFFSKATSYENDKSVGTVQFEIKDSAITDAHVLIIEDIFDTGLTMKKIVDTVKQKGAKSVKSCVLLHKKNNDNMQYSDYFSDYIGFCIPDKFVIGYGLDFNDFLRDMEHVCVISQLAIDKYKV